MNPPPNPHIDDYVRAYRAYQREQSAKQSPSSGGTPAPVVARGDATTDATTLERAERYTARLVFCEVCGVSHEFEKVETEKR